MADLTSLVRTGIEAHLPRSVDADRLLGGARTRARRRRIRARVLLASAAALVVAATAGVWSGAAQPVVAALGGPGTIVETPCPSDVGFCGPSYTFAGRPYEGPGCTPVRRELVSDDVVARGRIGGERTEVRRVIGVDPALLVAVRRTTTGCDEQGRAPEPWSLAFAAPDDDQDAVRLRDRHRAVCDVVLGRDRARNRCGAVDVRSTSRADLEAPVTSYDAQEWPARPDELDCRAGTVRYRATLTVPGGYALRQAAVVDLEARVVDALSAPGAAHTSTVAYRQVGGTVDRHEELFFRGDGVPVAFGAVTRTSDGRWAGSYVGCVPPSAVPAGGVRAQ